MVIVTEHARAPSGEKAIMIMILILSKIDEDGNVGEIYIFKVFDISSWIFPLTGSDRAELRSK